VEFVEELYSGRVGQLRSANDGGNFAGVLIIKGKKICGTGEFSNTVSISAQKCLNAVTDSNIRLDNAKLSIQWPV
jgi:hypothetical protein